MQVPSPSAAACRQSWLAAMPMSSSLYSLSCMTLPTAESMFCFSSTTAMMTGACRTNLFIPIPAAASPMRSLSSGSSTTTNLHGWELLAEGDRRAVSMHCISFSSSTAFPE